MISNRACPDHLQYPTGINAHAQGRQVTYIPGAKDLCLDLCLDEESSVLLSIRMLPLLREAGLWPDRSLCRAEGLPGGPGGPVEAFRSRQLVGKKRAPGPTPAAVFEFGSSGWRRPSLRFPTDLASLSML